MEEIWKPVPEYEGIYSVSNLGRVRKEAQILKGGINTDGYPFHTLSHNNKRWCISVHLLVARAFLPPKPSPKHEVNHEDRVKTNCRADNLSWMTPSQNVQHSFRVGTRKRNKGTDNPACVLTETQVKTMRADLDSGVLNTVSAGKKFGVSQGTAWRIKKRLIWGHLA